ncbi:MAG: 2-amino-4-hydroxy-6-hydroxymethyldihydropteridine diphosphokinase [Bacteroidota bacterium]|nr:2-amino-4-hydroxy-6-hydroxymethyldihydropteridine diphosphokinase [Bacteroidota bacterium]
MNTVYILTGGNLGNRMGNLEKAAWILEQEIGKIINSSSMYKTAAWGNTNQPDFYNQVHVIKTKFSAKEVMEKILKIEEKMGRVRTSKNAARIIDIDILFFNDNIVNLPGLIIPHPEIANRRFVLEPLNELSPQLIHPLLNKTMKDLLSTCKDMLDVTPIQFR